MNQFLFREDVDHRVLGAVRCVNDVDGTPLRDVLNMGPSPAVQPGESSPLRILPKGAGLYVLCTATGFASYTDAFEPPALPPRVLRLRVTDPGGRYFPAEAGITLPRSSDRADDPNVFTPQEIRLLPSPAAPVADGWAVLRAFVWRDLTAGPGARQAAVPGSLVRVLTDDAGRNPLARGLTEWRPRAGGLAVDAAEALVAVPGIPVTDWSREANGSVVTTGRSVRLQASFDTTFNPAVAHALPDFARLAPSAGPLPAEVRSTELPAALHLEAGERRTLHVAFNADGTALRAIDPRDLNLN